MGIRRQDVVPGKLVEGRQAKTVSSRRRCLLVNSLRFAKSRNRIKRMTSPKSAVYSEAYGANGKIGPSLRDRPVHQ